MLIQDIKSVSEKYSKNLNLKISERVEEMKNDNFEHYLIYEVLGIDKVEGHNIDLYQNKGRFLYKYAGAFLEEVAFLCFNYKFPEATKIRIPNDQGQRPKTFEIDCLIGNRAYEIKWRDATIDGDHITKEHTRVLSIKNQGYTPVRIMFYYPNRSQSIKIQKTLETLYKGVGGEYYFGDSAWEYLLQTTGVDLHNILKDIASSKSKNGGELNE